MGIAIAAGEKLSKLARVRKPVPAVALVRSVVLVARDMKMKMVTGFLEIRRGPSPRPKSEPKM